jgi:hypothetical protein
MSITYTRWFLSFFISFVLTSNLNWAIAELLLNPWLVPAMGDFIRQGEEAATAANIMKMSFGFMLSILAMSIILPLMRVPYLWWRRALLVGGLFGLAGFFGTYTFISGWGRVEWFPLMVTAVCDTVTLFVGALIIGFIQRDQAMAN